MDQSFLHNSTESARRFQVANEDVEPAYLALHRRGGLKQRVEEALQSLAHCEVCPRNCGVDRLGGKTGVCKSGRYARVSSYAAHFGEEDCLRGWHGSGTIFFSWCNLRCVFCQNYTISQDGMGVDVSPARLAAMMLALQAEGCHNINFVTPEHVVPQLLEGLLIAVESGLQLPIVYNTSAYDSLHSLRLLDGIVDIYMPDFKFWDPRLALRYLKAKDYPEVARCAVQEMHRQVGPLQLDENGLARRGVLVRHLVIPGLLEETKAILRFLAKEVSPDTYVNLMDQYYPAWKVTAGRYDAINRATTRQEYEEARQLAQEAGLWRLDDRRSFWARLVW
jgi:putative pyruvate formate lyase activating enzyme